MYGLSSLTKYYELANKSIQQHLKFGYNIV